MAQLLQKPTCLWDVPKAKGHNQRDVTKPIVIMIIDISIFFCLCLGCEYGDGATRWCGYQSMILYILFWSRLVSFMMCRTCRDRKHHMKLINTVKIYFSECYDGIINYLSTSWHMFALTYQKSLWDRNKDMHSSLFWIYIYFYLLLY